MKKESTKSIDNFFLVSNQPLFKSLSDKEKAFIANRVQVVEYKKGNIIYEEGQKRGYLYMVISGRISLFHPPHKAPTKKEMPIEILRKGDYFGIISLLTGKPHSLSSRVMSDARILRIDQASFKEILNNIPTLAIEISRILSRRLKQEYKGIKEIFQSTILSVYCESDKAYAFYYAENLARGIRKESGKKVAVIEINPKKHPQETLNILRRLTGTYHFVLAVLPSLFERLTDNILRQSDLCHIVCDDILKDTKNLGAIFRKIKNVTKRNPEDFIKIILREKTPLLKNHIIPNQKISIPVYATLPENKTQFEKTIRRISREISGVLVGLALGSGGAFGLAQIGILEILEKEKIPIDVLAGTSIGALIGALWASGYSSKEITKISVDLNTKLKTIGLIDLVFPKKGLIAGRKLRRFLFKYLKDRTFYDIKLPFRVVTCDIRTRKEVIISNGKLVDAVMASIAIPGLVNPQVTERGDLLVDGGVTNPVPISVLSQAGVKRIIAINSLPPPEDIIETSPRRYTILDILVNSIYAMEYRIAKYACQEADVYLHPILENAAWYEFYRAKEFIRLGRRYMLRALPKVRQLIKRR